LKNWSADFCNDPHDDYNLVVEVLRDNEDMAIIKKIDGKLEMQWYPCEHKIAVPVDWLLALLGEATKRL
jgi:hypothetical protein